MGRERRWPRWIKKALHIGILNMGRERRWPRWIKKALHIGILNMGRERRWPRWMKKKALHIGILNMGRERRWPRWIKKALHIGIKRLCMGVPWEQSLWVQHGAHLGPTGPRWALCWPHKLCYLAGSPQWLMGCNIHGTGPSHFVNMIQVHRSLWEITMAHTVWIHSVHPLLGH